MSQLDSIKEKLSKLQPGQELRVHHMLLGDAIADDRREWLANRSPFVRVLDDMPDAYVPTQIHDFGDWLKINGFIPQQNPSSDSLVIVRK